MTTVIERPHFTSFSKNEIRYVFELDDPARAGLYLQVQIFYSQVGTAPQTLLETFDLKPTADGIVFLHVQAYLDSVLTHVLPTLGDQITIADAQACTYSIQFREIEDANPDPNWVTTEITDHDPRIAIKGGIEKHKHARNNFFVNYWDSQLPFMTWQPQNRFIFPGETTFLTFINPNVANTNYFIQVTAYDTDGNGNLFYSQLPTTTFYIAHVRTDPNWLSVPSSLPGQIHYYTVQIVDGDSNPVTQPYNYYIEYRPLYEYYDLYFHNSISGFDNVRVSGEIDHNFSRSTVEAQGGLKLDDWTSNIKPHAKKFSSITLQRTYKANAGILKTRTKEEQEALIELFASKGIYQIIDGRWIPVINLKDSQDLGSRRNIIDGFPIEWSLSEANEVYTPKQITFGQGIIVPEAPPPPPCIAMSLPTLFHLPDATVGQAYSYSITLTAGTLPISLTWSNIPSWMNLSLTGYTLTATGTPDGVITNQAITITLTNCAGEIKDEQPFSVAAAPIVGTLSLLSNTDTGPGGQRTEIFEVGDPVAVGKTYSLEVYSHRVDVVAVAGDTPTTMATKLKDAVNATTQTQWNSVGSAPAAGTNGFPPAATSSGAQITIVLDYQHQFAASVL